MLCEPCLASAHAQMLDDDVVRVHVDTAADQRDTGRRCRLAGDRDVGIAYVEHVTGQIDHATDLEHDRARLGQLDRGFKGPRSVGVERRDAHDATAVPARRQRRSRADPKIDRRLRRRFAGRRAMLTIGS